MLIVQLPLRVSFSWLCKQNVQLVARGSPWPGSNEDAQRGQAQRRSVEERCGNTVAGPGEDQEQEPSRPGSRGQKRKLVSTLPKFSTIGERMTRLTVQSNPDCLLPASLNLLHNVQTPQQARMGPAHAEQHSSSFSLEAAPCRHACCLDP